MAKSCMEYFGHVLDPNIINVSKPLTKECCSVGSKQNKKLLTDPV